MNLTTTERYLAGFHDTNLGVTSRSFAALPASQGPRAVLDLFCGDGHLLFNAKARA